MTEFTPGPWKYSTGSVYKAESVDADGYPTSAIEHMDRENPDTFGAERDANARLIAAAPDLLEALQELVAEVENNEALNHHAFETTGFNMAFAAIAKAEGSLKDDLHISHP